MCSVAQTVASTANYRPSFTAFSGPVRASHLRWSKVSATSRCTLVPTTGSLEKCAPLLKVIASMPGSTAGDAQDRSQSYLASIQRG